MITLVKTNISFLDAITLIEDMSINGSGTFKSEWDFDWDDKFQLTFKFKTPEDALAFKLKFGI